jgi:hypothetical protein
MSLKAQVESLINKLNSFKVEYMIIGGMSCLLQGMDYVMQDLDLYLDNREDTKNNFIKALQDLGYSLENIVIDEIMKGKAFIYMELVKGSDTLDLDIMFYPNGFAVTEIQTLKRWARDEKMESNKLLNKLWG